MIEIVLATNNESKALQIKEIFVDSNFQILTQGEVGIVGEAVEDGETLEDNATSHRGKAFRRAKEFLENQSSM